MRQNVTLNAATRFGPYEILAPVGKGGTGQVWKARDLRLDRIVAARTDDLVMKYVENRVATPKLVIGSVSKLGEAAVCSATDPDRLTRFTREVQMPASLKTVEGAFGLAKPMADDLAGDGLWPEAGSAGLATGVANTVVFFRDKS